MELRDFIVVDESENGYSLVSLKEIFFHPQGGGQPCDKLLDKNGNAISVLKQGNEILLAVQPNAIDNGRIEITIDTEFRGLCSRLHSAGHLLALVVSELYKTEPVKAHHFPNECYVKFSGDIPKEFLTDIQNILDKKILNNTSVTISDDDGNRFVNFDGIGGYPCGGTHVTELQQIGDVLVGPITSKKGQTTIKYSLLN